MQVAESARALKLRKNLSNCSSSAFRLLEDFEFDPKMSLLGDNEELSQSCLCLLLTGVARPHLHNGNVLCDDEGNYLVSDRLSRAKVTRDHKWNFKAFAAWRVAARLSGLGV